MNSNFLRHDNEGETFDKQVSVLYALQRIGNHLLLSQKTHRTSSWKGLFMPEMHPNGAGRERGSHSQDGNVWNRFFAGYWMSFHADFGRSG